MLHKLKYLVLLLELGCFFAEAQTFHNPFNFPLYLSGNFGELRPDHFHSGIDFKTQGVEGKPVHAAKDGYVCRIVVSPRGYGNVVYLAHPADRIKTVYAHLQRFTEEMHVYVKEKQYEQECFSVDLSFSPEDYPVKEGEIIGYSGNSGSSGGPHLHFEVRDLATDEPMDPLPFFKERIKDTRSPKARAIMIYPVEGEGTVNNSSRKQQLQLITSETGQQSVSGKIEAWGKIAFSINVDDFMDGTGNVYGVNELIMYVDDRKVFRSCLDRFSLNETRYINAWVDYEIWRNKRSFFTKTHVEPGNHLRFITSENRGYIQIDEPRNYQIVFQLADIYGNITRIPVHVTGKEQLIHTPDTDGTAFFCPNSENRFGAKGIRLYIPEGSLYSYVYFRHNTEKSKDYFSDIHQLHDSPVPLHQKAKISLYISGDSLDNKAHYGIVSIRKNARSWIGGLYRDGWIDGDISELGNGYAIAIDTIPPKITPVNETKWMNEKLIAFRITDNLSGVKSYRGEIDGQYVLFEFDAKKASVRYEPDPVRLKHGKHHLSLTVTDLCGNNSVHESSFEW
ncbi:MAG: M23 family metallopeptidase [Tannerella sp.]|jgi:hypothetical protein|nr:M23 family metallopeptidase [Tannerella sp.]